MNKIVTILNEFSCPRCKREHVRPPPTHDDLYYGRIYRYRCPCGFLHAFFFYRSDWTWEESEFHFHIGNKEWSCTYDPEKKETTFNPSRFGVDERHRFPGFVSHERFTSLSAFM